MNALAFPATLLISILPLAPATALAADRAPPAGIEKISEGKYKIAQEEFYRLLGSMAFLSSQARLRPVIRNKVVAGYQIYKIRKDSVFLRLGLKDGDRLVRINDVPLDGPRRKNQLLGKVGQADKIELILIRKGKRIQLTYLLDGAPEAPKPAPETKPNTEEKTAGPKPAGVPAE